MRTAARRHTVGVVLILLILPLGSMAGDAQAPFMKMAGLLGEKDAVLIADAKGEVLFAKNAGKPLIPASSLKVLTALVAIKTLGEDFRFTTKFYIDADSNLTIKGYGDPLLISESLKQIAAVMKDRTPAINDLVLDDDFFQKPLTIPGTADRSVQPYDAPCGALCVNFNTVSFKYENGEYVSAEPQTPLLPLAIKQIRASGLTAGRILLAGSDDEILAYTGGLFEFFFKQAGIQIRGEIRSGRVDRTRDQLIYTYASGFKLTEVVSRLIEYSNNFIANQLLLAAGAARFGMPATLDKGIRAAEEYARTSLEITDMVIAEGSGVSRKNRVSALMFLKILNAFSPYHDLMRREGNEYYKTGSLAGINTRIGFIETKKGGLYRFVVLLNTPGKNIDPVMGMVRRAVD